MVEEKGGLRICQNEEEHQRQWDETEKTREEVMLMINADADNADAKYDDADQADRM